MRLRGRRGRARLFTMLGLPYYAQDFGTGIVLLIALPFSFTFARRRVAVTAGSTTSS